MNILKKISILLLLVGVFQSPLMAQKKLALANECFNAKAYYLASRYYQDFFGKIDDCHPDQLKMAQSLAATHQLAAAEDAFHRYMNCQSGSSVAYLAYGKFLMDIEAYEKAIPYFEKAMETEPQLARHYMLACRTALPKPVETGTSVFVHQITEPYELPTDGDSDTIHPVEEVQPVSPAELPKGKVMPAHIDKTTSTTTNINLFDAMVSAEKNVEEKEVNLVLTEKSSVSVAPESVVVEKEKLPEVVVNKTISPYGVRLGTYTDDTIPDLLTIQAYGTIEQKQWNGKTILFLVDFPSRAAAEAAVTIALQNKFRSATLVEKLKSGRMKSVK